MLSLCSPLAPTLLVGLAFELLQRCSQSWHEIWHLTTVVYSRRALLTCSHLTFSSLEKRIAVVQLNHVWPVCTLQLLLRHTAAAPAGLTALCILRRSTNYKWIHIWVSPMSTAEITPICLAEYLGVRPELWHLVWGDLSSVKWGRYRSIFVCRRSTGEIELKRLWWQGEQHFKHSILNFHNLGQTSLFKKSNK